MSYLEQFTADQRELLVSLPYRTGLWVSESDESGGDESAEAEMQALEGIITGYSQDYLKSEFVEELMRETLERRDSWENWQENLENVPDECRQAIDILNGHMDGKEVLNFRQNLMEIATAVALAYREIDESEDRPGRLKAYANHYWGVLTARLKKEQQPGLEHHLNISQAEREVLGRLSSVLQVSFDGVPIDDALTA